MTDLRITATQWKKFRELKTKVVTVELKSQLLTVTETIFSWLEMKEGLAMHGTFPIMQNDGSKIERQHRKEWIRRVEQRFKVLAGWYAGQSLMFKMSTSQIDKEVFWMIVLKRFDLAQGNMRCQTSSWWCRNDWAQRNCCSRAKYDADAIVEPPSEDQSPSKILTDLGKEMGRYEQSRAPRRLWNAS